MVRPQDREYAGSLAAVLMVGRILRAGWPQFEEILPVCAECANVAVHLIQAIDKHLPVDKAGHRKYRR